jgi:hypothetical protein
MRVSKRDGACRSCGGQLEITGADDATMTVECLDCGDEYPVETDAFGDGGIDYYPRFLAEELERRRRVS